MKKRQLIAMLSCLVVGMAGFAGVYTTEKAKDNAELEQPAQQEQEEKTQQASTIVQPKPQIAEAQKTETPKETADTESRENTEETKETNSTNVAKTDSPKPAAKTEKPAAEPAEETVAEDTALHFKPEDGMRWPLEGNVLLNYSMDHTIYFPTLEQYQYNPALVIAGDVNSKVYLAAKGQIVDISTSEETGCTVTEDLGDGYTAIYGQLKELNFEVGDTVERGQVIGYVSEPTKYYSVEGSNLYFAMEKDGEPVDPLEYFE